MKNEQKSPPIEINRCLTPILILPELGGTQVGGEVETLDAAGPGK